MAPSHASTSEQVAAAHKVSVGEGLTSGEVDARREKWGPNRLPEPPRPSELLRLAEQFRSPIILTLLAAAVIALLVAMREGPDMPFLQRFGDAIAILLVVLLNAGLGYFQERRAESALLALERMQANLTRVRRDGVVRSIAAHELVPGDILELEAGDVVPADARLAICHEVTVDESTLTGESAPVRKDASLVLEPDAPLAERLNLIFTGTSLTRGRAVAIATATAENTELGQISALLRRPRSEPTPLEDRMGQFGRRVLWVCLLVSGVLFGWGLFLGRRHWLDVLLESVSFAVAAIPEGLPAVTTITLALGVQRMARRGAIVRRLPAVETLGSVTVLCTDKTGTLTTNQMTIREAYTLGGDYRVSGEGFSLAGSVFRDESVVDSDSDVLLEKLTTIGTVCNGANLSRTGDTVRVLGDPTEAALLVLAEKARADSDLRARVEVVSELPFDSERKRMSVQVRDPDGRVLTYVKGALDSILDRCDRALTPDGVHALDAKVRGEIQARADEMGSQALRVLALAYGENGLDEPESRLIFVGLVGMLDPPRSGVREAIADCHSAGVRVVMITGDHPLTARAIAEELDLWEAGDEVLSGRELEHLSEPELLSRIAHIRVFARTSPEQKLRIVGAFKARGEIVAMTGDGVNDAPALREAHIGVAMGKDGTEVARQAADVVITDDDFSTLVVAVAEGRAIYRNIQKFVFFLLSSNAGLALSVFAVTLVPSALPLTPLMILWINLVTNGLPALALGVDPSSRESMRGPPRRPDAGMLGARDYLGIAFAGTAMAAGALWAHFAGGDPRSGVTLAFTVLALAPLFHAFSCRSPTESILAQKPLVSRPLLFACAISAGVQLSALVVPALRPMFRTSVLSFRDWAIVLVASGCVVVLVEIAKAIDRARVRLHPAH